MLKDSELKTLPDGRHKDGARYPPSLFLRQRREPILADEIQTDRFAEG